MPGVTGKFGPGVQNEAGQRLTEFCQENALVIASTHFQQNKRRLYTWKSLGGQYWNRLITFLKPKMEKAYAAAAAAKSLQSCLTLCDPIDGSPPGFPIPGILQARTLEWVAISFFNAWKRKVEVKSLSLVWLLATHGLQPTRFLCPWDLPGKSIGVGCRCLLQEGLLLSHKTQR